MKRKNLVILHLESIAWQAVNAFPESFPNLRRLTPGMRAFPWYFSSATSTQMVLAHLAHANDFEQDAASGLAAPVGNNPSLFALLRDAGYRTSLLCVSAIRVEKMLPLLAGTLPPISTTNDFGELLDQFEQITSAPPFATYVWNLATHIEHAVALTPYAAGPDDVVAGACAVADHAIGALYDILARKNLIDETTVVIFGDHGDDYWTHGFKYGALHGIEPYTHLLHAPLLIGDSSLPSGVDHRLVSTVDIAPTCLDLMNLPVTLPFEISGSSLLGDRERSFAFAQNFTANQADAAEMDIRKAFSVSDRSYTLLVSSRGLELFNHRLDPANHCNLLHLYDIGKDGELVLRQRHGPSHPHFTTGMRYLLTSKDAVSDRFRGLRTALRQHVMRKNAYVAARNPERNFTLDLACLDTANRREQDHFFGASRTHRDKGSTEERWHRQLIKRWTFRR